MRTSPKALGTAQETATVNTAQNAGLHIRVFGEPAPQGSKRHVGHGIMVESSKKVKPWREAVKYATLVTQPDENTPLNGPVSVTIWFYLRRPQGHFGTGRNIGQLRSSAPKYPAVRPDIDKLARSTLDALGDANVFTDDSRVVMLTTFKRYATNLDPSGAHIFVKEVVIVDKPGHTNRHQDGPLDTFLQLLKETTQ